MQPLVSPQSRLGFLQGLTSSHSECLGEILPPHAIKVLCKPKSEEQEHFISGTGTKQHMDIDFATIAGFLNIMRQAGRASLMLW